MSPFRPKQKAALLERAVPVSGELPAYGGGYARRDVLAGITVAALALPSAMAVRSRRRDEPQDAGTTSPA